jgi:hypothetical protein
MQMWMWVLLLGVLIKLPIAGLMIWLPIRNDQAAYVPDQESSQEDEGGSHALPGGPLDPHPRAPRPGRPGPPTPRRDPHGSPAPPAPRRVRIGDRRPARTVLPG